jgi:thymidylate synthase (FAD)
MGLRNKYFKVLDHGFISLVDYMGSDNAIEDAARVSYGDGTRSTSDTRALLRYMMNHQHLGPFEQAELKFHIKMPIFVMRQFIRHRQFSINELSMRYSEAPEEMYQPKEWRKQTKGNKQGSEGTVDSWPEDYIPFVSDGLGRVRPTTPVEYLIDTSRNSHRQDRNVYQERLAFDVSRELARIDLPLSQYTEFYAKIDLRNLLHFLKLRLDEHAQWEIRQYAHVIACIVNQLFPLSMEAWLDYVYDAQNFSRMDLELLLELTGYWAPAYDYEIHELEEMYPHKAELHKKIGMTDRELKEFWEKLKPKKSLNLDMGKLVEYDM